MGQRVVTLLLVGCVFLGSWAAGGTEPIGEPSSATPDLRQLLAELPCSLTREASDRRYVVSPAATTDHLDAYAAHMLAALLELHNGPAELLAEGAPPTSEPFGSQMSSCLLRRLRMLAATVFVRLGATMDQGERQLTVACYDVASGALLARTHMPFHLPSDLEALVTGQGEPLAESDARWLRLLEEAFASADAAPAEPDAMLQAEASYLMGAGLWRPAAQAYQKLAGGKLCRPLMKAVFCWQLAGEWELADSLLQSTLNRHFDSAPLYALGGWVALRQNRPSDALMMVEQAQLTDMTREGLWSFARALIAVEQGDGLAAESAFRKAAALLPQKLFVLERVGLFYWNRAELQQALPYFQQAASHPQADVETLAQLAMVHEAAGQLQNALSVLRRAFGMRSNSPMVARQLASVLKRLGRHSESLDVLRRAKDANPCHPALLVAYGDGAVEMWEIEEAEQAFRQALAIAPDLPYATVRLARALHLQRQYQEAESLLTRLLAQQPEYQSARLALGRILGELGKREEAISILSAAARSSEHEVAARLAMADIYVRFRQADEAVRCAQIAVSRRPDATTYAALSAAFLSAQDADKAEETARMAISANARAPAGPIALARALRQTERLEEALEHAQRAVELAPYSVEAIELNGDVRRALGDYRQCAALWTRALDLNPWHAELHRKMAELLGMTLGESDAALRHYDRYFELEKLRANASL